MKIIKTENYVKIKKESYVPPHPTYMTNDREPDPSSKQLCRKCDSSTTIETLKRNNGYCDKCYKDKNK